MKTQKKSVQSVKKNSLKQNKKSLKKKSSVKPEMKDSKKKISKRISNRSPKGTKKNRKMKGGIGSASNLEANKEGTGFKNYEFLPYYDFVNDPEKFNFQKKKQGRLVPKLKENKGMIDLFKLLESPESTIDNQKISEKIIEYIGQRLEAEGYYVKETKVPFNEDREIYNRLSAAMLRLPSLEIKFPKFKPENTPKPVNNCFLRSSADQYFLNEERNPNKEDMVENLKKVLNVISNQECTEKRKPWMTRKNYVYLLIIFTSGHILDGIKLSGVAVYGLDRNNIYDEMKDGFLESELNTLHNTIREKIEQFFSLVIDGESYIEPYFNLVRKNGKGALETLVNSIREKKITVNYKRSSMHIHACTILNELEDMYKRTTEERRRRTTEELEIKNFFCIFSAEPKDITKKYNVKGVKDVAEYYSGLVRDKEKLRNEKGIDILTTDVMPKLREDMKLLVFQTQEAKQKLSNAEKILINLEQLVSPDQAPKLTTDFLNDTEIIGEEGFKDWVRAFYTLRVPDKIEEVDKIVETFKDREQQLIGVLNDKYPISGYTAPRYVPVRGTQDPKGLELRTSTSPVSVVQNLDAFSSQKKKSISPRSSSFSWSLRSPS